ncbi:MAG TPA: phosphate ABC transporter substrate-binding protein PstS [Acidimicrobiales bacterium]|nr:phosphate ABC transporter substrate-binding protein PstS [Acidimicrobiales bacterium]
MSKRALAAAFVLLSPLVSGAGASAQAHFAPAVKSSSSSPSVTLNGAGANSIDPFFESVFYAYHKANPKVTINYDPAGSSVGVSEIQAQTVDFGDSEIPMSAKDLAKANGTVLQVPVDLGGVAISYNVPGAPKDLKLDGPTLAAIFEGKITVWNSPVLEAETGVNNLPALPIIPVHRADNSGPSWDVDAYLIQTSQEWASMLRTNTPSKAWPVLTWGVGEQLNSGVASYIAQTPGAIGYVEYGYALKAGFANAAIKNLSGNYIIPSEPSLAKAGINSKNLSATDFSIVNSPGPTTYPLANFSWTLLYQKQSNVAKGEALKALFEYVVTKGQSEAGALGYAPLPANVQQLAISTLSQLEGPNGKPLP